MGKNKYTTELAKKESRLISSFETWEEATAAKRKIAWKQLEAVSVGSAIQNWLPTLGEHTSKSYRYGMKKLCDLGLVDHASSLQSFSQVNHNSIIDQIKLVDGWSESTRQSRAACYISFTGFLSRRTDGLIIKGLPQKEGNARTFFRVRQKVKTDAMNQRQWGLFIKKLENLNARDALIAKLTFQGGKRISEVLALKIGDIEWNNRVIVFKQSKTRGTDQRIYITYPAHIFDELNDYLGNRNAGLVFITRNMRKIHPGQLERNFAKAGVLADIGFKITPHVLRTTLVTYLKTNGYSDTDIMKITGHHSAEMVAAYDKMDGRLNPSQNINLV